MLAEGEDDALVEVTAFQRPWTVIRFGPRSGPRSGPRPRTDAQAHALTDGQLTRLVRIWLANRGIWEALPGAGPPGTRHPH